MGNLKVQKQLVASLLRRQAHGSLAGARLADHGKVALRAENRDQAVAHDGVIVGYHDTNRGRHTSSSSGTVSTTRVPEPGLLCTRICPPSRRALSFMPTRP